MRRPSELLLEMKRWSLVIRYGGLVDRDALTPEEATRQATFEMLAWMHRQK